MFFKKMCFAQMTVLSLFSQLLKTVQSRVENVFFKKYSRKQNHTCCKNIMIITDNIRKLGAMTNDAYKWTVSIYMHKTLPAVVCTFLLQTTFVHMLSLQLVDTKKWYCREFKDSLMIDPPSWFFAFLLCEVLLQFPFFFVATYAYLKGIYPKQQLIFSTIYDVILVLTAAKFLEEK